MRSAKVPSPSPTPNLRIGPASSLSPLCWQILGVEMEDRGLDL